MKTFEHIFATSRDRAVEVLHKALAHMKQYGWISGKYEDPASQRCCAMGAIRRATEDSYERSDAQALLCQALGRPANAESYVTGWNDTAGRTEEQVRELFRAAVDGRRAHI